MTDDDILCKRCGQKLELSMVREKDKMPTYNFLITKFSVGDLGKQSKNLNLCWICKAAFDKFMKELKRT